MTTNQSWPTPDTTAHAKSHQSLVALESGSVLPYNAALDKVQPRVSSLAPSFPACLLASGAVESACIDRLSPRSLDLTPHAPAMLLL